MKVRYEKPAGALAIGCLLGGILLGGCGSATAQDVSVRWLLADGRSCVDAAVPSVTIQAVDASAPGGGRLVSGACPADARADGRITLPAVLPGMRLQGRGLSSSNTVLYQGQLTVPDPVTPTLDLTLYFTGGR